MPVKSPDLKLLSADKSTAPKHGITKQNWVSGAPGHQILKEKRNLIYLSELTNRYRIVNDEAWEHERPEVRSPDRRWYEQMPCRAGGLIYLYSEDPPTLCLYTTQVKSARAIMSKIPGLKAEWLDGEAVIYFPPEVLDQVVEMAGARKKRQGRRLSAAEKSQLVEAGKAHRFKNQSTGLQAENLPRI